MKIFHNPRCSKSRETLNLLKSSDSDIQIVEYLKDPPTKEELEELLKKLDMRPIELIRKGETIFIKGYKDKQLTDEEWVDVMVKHPVLIERPIVVKGDKAVVARPPERVKELL